MNRDYNKLEADILAVTAALGECLTMKELQEVRAFIDAGEYGVAFETLCSIIKEEGKSVSPTERAALVELGQRMEIDPKCWHNIESS